MRFLVERYLFSVHIYRRMSLSFPQPTLKNGPEVRVVINTQSPLHTATCSVGCIQQSRYDMIIGENNKLACMYQEKPPRQENLQLFVAAGEQELGGCHKYELFAPQGPQGTMILEYNVSASLPPLCVCGGDTVDPKSVKNGTICP